MVHAHGSESFQGLKQTGRNVPKGRCADASRTPPVEDQAILQRSEILDLWKVPELIHILKRMVTPTGIKKGN